MVQSEVSAQDWELAAGITQESSVEIAGTVREDKRSPWVTSWRWNQLPSSTRPKITPSPQGAWGGFPSDHRHLWLRTPRQVIMHIRNTIVKALRDWLDSEGFTLIDAPIMTPACEGTTTLFETEYFGDKAYLLQSGQLYMEAAAMALGRVYCFGPTFRAESPRPAATSSSSG